MKITRVDPFTHKSNTLELDISEEDLDRWKSGMLIQHAFPHLTPDEREFIMTGITPESWEAAFGDKDEIYPDEWDEAFK